MTVTQMAAMNAYRNYGISGTLASKSLSRISSGYRINSAADDAAGLAVSEKMRAQITGMSVAERNANEAIALIRTADGHMDESASILQRMRELANQSANGTYGPEEREALNKEVTAMKSELNRIAGASDYNGISLLNGSFGGVKGDAGISRMGISGITAAGDLQQDANFSISRENGVLSVTARVGDETVRNEITNLSDTFTEFQLKDGNTIRLDFTATAADLKDGAVTNVAVDGNQVSTSRAMSANSTDKMDFQVGPDNAISQRISLRIGDVSAEGLGVTDIDISTTEGAREALSVLNDAINQLSSERGTLGATHNRLEHTVNNLSTSRLNLADAESKIRDADIAKEMMNYMQQSIMMQASQAMMAQGMNLTRQNMLALLSW